MMLAVLAALFLLAATAAAASADPPTGSPGELNGQGRLDLYVIETTADVASAMRTDGYDVISESFDGEVVTIEVIMSPSEANKASRAYGLDLKLKRNKNGQTTAQAAFEEVENGFEVWRRWDEPGGHKAEMEFLAEQYDDITELITIGPVGTGRRHLRPPDHRKRLTRSAVVPARPYSTSRPSTHVSGFHPRSTAG